MASDAAEVKALRAGVQRFRESVGVTEVFTLDDAAAGLAALDAHRAKVGPSDEDCGAVANKTPLSCPEADDALRAYLRAKAASHGGDNG